MVKPEPASAALNNPSVPEFTVKLVDNSIVVAIKNQPFSVSSPDGFYYNIQTKVHSSEDWTGWYNPSDGYPTQDLGSEYTVISVGWDGSSISVSSHGVEIPSGSQIDF
jgi:hypothetical protein